jgi:hypothetical protein
VTSRAALHLERRRFPVVMSQPRPCVMIASTLTLEDHDSGLAYLKMSPCCHTRTSRWSCGERSTRAAPIGVAPDVPGDRSPSEPVDAH